MESKHQDVERPFYWSVKGLVKMLRMAVTAASMTFFIIAQAPEPYIVITGFECTIAFFFISLYMCRLDKMMRWLFWPLLDIINSMVAILFMLIVSVFALIPQSSTLTALGGVFGLLTTVCAIADSALMCRKLLFNPSGPYLQRSSTQSRE
ncbi:chemokine-like factor [Cricetulus griseus]|uniref:Chemokine-like factor n=1 Tax=Cricetulus griseus TaxID=10029 RepID=G3H660_CRIGR|nr:chemokine-like factor [Cricetulus griseus]XP_027261540.1 chemokine-like factor [Cricetulus griseus]EGV98591.1 Chemokine-like factor [Cricetulus griseus]ERE77305.1 chemokine-like factor-like protein [Cricetulus griseus]